MSTMQEKTKRLIDFLTKKNTSKSRRQDAVTPVLTYAKLKIEKIEDKTRDAPLMISCPHQQRVFAFLNEKT